MWGVDVFGGRQEDRGPAESVVVDLDPAASFDELYRFEYPALLRLAWSLTGRRDLAEELVQDVMLKVHADWDRLRDYDSPGAFARRVLLNDATSAARRRASERRALARLQSDTTHRDDAPPDESFWAMLRSLPERQAQVLALHYVEDLAVTDVARTLDIAEGTVKAHLHRGRLALAELLRDELEEGR